MFECNALLIHNISLSYLFFLTFFFFKRCKYLSIFKVHKCKQIFGFNTHLRQMLAMLAFSCIVTLLSISIKYPNPQCFCRHQFSSAQGSPLQSAPPKAYPIDPLTPPLLPFFNQLCSPPPFRQPDITDFISNRSDS